MDWRSRILGLALLGAAGLLLAPLPVAERPRPLAQVVESVAAAGATVLVGEVVVRQGPLTPADRLAQTDGPALQPGLVTQELAGLELGTAVGSTNPSGGLLASAPELLPRDPTAPLRPVASYLVARAAPAPRFRTVVDRFSNLLTWGLPDARGPFGAQAWLIGSGRDQARLSSRSSPGEIDPDQQGEAADTQQWIVPRPAPDSPWVAVHRPTELWSGTDNLAISFREVGQDARFQIARPQDGPRLYVWDPTTENYAYIDALNVGPSEAPKHPPVPVAPIPFWQGTARVTMYTCVELGGCNRTASGIWPYEGVVAVDPRVIPLGSKVWIDGLGVFLAADTGGAVKGNKIDVFSNSYPRAIQWGVQYLEASAWRD